MKFGIIGYGNLGKATVKGLVGAGVPQNDILVNAKSEKTRLCVQEDFAKIYVTDSKRELLENSDAVILVVEPKNAGDVLGEFRNYDIKDKIIISFMAGITRQEIRQMLGKQGADVKVLRVMPNLAIASGNGVLGITYDEPDAAEIQDILHAFGKLGYMLRLEEDSLEFITVTAASGLAFGAGLMNSYQKACNTLFQDAAKSKEITLRVFEDVIDMIRSEDCSFEDIMKRIATKGGTTEAGMNCLKQEMITETCSECVNAAYQRAKNIL